MTERDDIILQTSSGWPSEIARSYDWRDEREEIAARIEQYRALSFRQSQRTESRELLDAFRSLKFRISLSANVMNSMHSPFTRDRIDLFKCEMHRVERELRGTLSEFWQSRPLGGERLKPEERRVETIRFVTQLCRSILSWLEEPPELDWSNVVRIREDLLSLMDFVFFDGEYGYEYSEEDRLRFFEKWCGWSLSTSRCKSCSGRVLDRVKLCLNCGNVV